MYPPDTGSPKRGTDSMVRAAWPHHTGALQGTCIWVAFIERTRIWQYRAFAHVSPPSIGKVIESIESAVKWFKKSEIKGVQKNTSPTVTEKRLPDDPLRRLSRTMGTFYELDTNRPFFSDRDGIKNTISQKSDMNAGTDIAGTIKTAAKYWQNMRNGRRN